MQNKPFYRLSRFSFSIALFGGAILTAMVFFSNWQGAGWGGLAFVLVWPAAAGGVGVFILISMALEILSVRRKEAERLNKRFLLYNILLALVVGSSMPAMFALDTLEKYQDEKKIIEQAHSGDPEALFQAGKLRLFEGETPEQRQDGIDYLKQAADLGHGKAQYKLALLFYHGKAGLVTRNDDKANEYLKKIEVSDKALFLSIQASAEIQQKWFDTELIKAKQGEAKSQCMIGIMYKRGEDWVAKRDFHEAARWITKSVDQGYDWCRDKLNNIFTYNAIWRHVNIGATMQQVLEILDRPTKITRGKTGAQDTNIHRRRYAMKIREDFPTQDYYKTYKYEKWLYDHGAKTYIVVFYGEKVNQPKTWKVIYKSP